MALPPTCANLEECEFLGPARWLEEGELQYSHWELVQAHALGVRGRREWWMVAGCTLTKTLETFTHMRLYHTATHLPLPPSLPPSH